MPAPASSPASLVVVASAAAGDERLRTLLTALCSVPAVTTLLRCSAASYDAFVTAATAAMPDAVRPLEDATRLEPGTIVVVPDGAGHRWSAGELRASGAADAAPVLEVAAAAFAAHATAIVLAGAVVPERELHAVRSHGGLIVFEDAGGAVPPAGTNDLIVDSALLEDAALELLTYEREPDLAHRRTLWNLLADVDRRSGIDFRGYKAPTVTRRIDRLVSAGGFASLGEYVRFLRANPGGYAKLVSSLLINVTEFFRDPALFAYLRTDVLPDVIERARRTGNEIRLWSAGCATGEEAYSLAILVAELLGEALHDFTVRIFATDLDEDAIAFARHGIYPAAALTDVPPELLERYFTKIDETYEVKKIVRNLTVFGHHDLAQRAPFPRIDLCLCRNVLIYFTKELQQRTLRVFAFSLRDAGYLVLGKAETTNPLPDLFRPVHRAFKTYRRYGPRVLIPPSRIRESASNARERIPAIDRDLPAHVPELAPSAQARAAPAGAFGRTGAGRPTPSERIAALILESRIGIVVVDRRYDIVAINQTARGFFNVHGVGVGEDLIHSAAGIDTGALRAGIDAAFAADGDEETHEFEVTDPLTDASRCIALTFCAHAVGEARPAVSIVAVDVTRQVVGRRDVERENEALRARVADLAEKNEPLVSRQRALVAANDQLTAANVELRSANDHLVIAAEEASAAAEEVETLNEEMQATNEELETLNEELQATVEELNTTNDELEARSREYQDLATDRERRRAAADVEWERLLGALELIDEALVILDDEGDVSYANPAYHALKSREPVEYALDGQPADDPLVRARKERFSDTYAVRFGDGTNTTLSVRALAYDGAGRVEGVLVAFSAGGER